jgi:hypothetical protein
MPACPSPEQLALAEQYAGRALVVLDRARALGLFKTSAAIEQLMKDSDLDPLRSRQDFKKFIIELEENAGPLGK